MSNRTEYDADFDSLGGDTINALQRPEQATRATEAVLAADTAERMPRIAAPPDTRLTLARGIRRDGELLRDAEVRELTGADEEELARAGTNWPRFLSTLVERGTVSVGGEPMTAAIGGELLIGDREALILAIRRVTFGNEIEVSEYECPYCGELAELTVHLDSIPVRYLSQDPDLDEYTVPLVRGRTAIVHLPTAADQDYVLSRAKNLTIAQQNSAMLTRCLRNIGELTGRGDEVRDLGWADRKTILKFLDDHQPGPRYNEVAFTHEPCGREVPLPITVAALFLGA
jgi:hypothetical protein